MTVRKILFLALLATAGMTDAWADYGYSYCDCDVKLHSPSSAQGVVYVDMDSSRKNEKNPSFQTGPSQTSEIRANLRVSDYSYKCYFMAYPKDGYVVDGFVTKADYNAGHKSHIYYLKDSGGKIFKSGREVIVEKQDTARDSKTDPITASDYRFSAKSSSEYYAIFRKANSQTVTVSAPGTLKEAVSRSTYGNEVDNLTVRGPIDETDINYLKTLVNDHNLVRLDLSGASISEIPSFAFNMCSSLYEIKLPKSGLTKIGSFAFGRCYNLKSVTVPSSVTEIAENAFNNCISKEFNIQ